MGKDRGAITMFKRVNNRGATSTRDFEAALPDFHLLTVIAETRSLTETEPAQCREVLGQHALEGSLAPCPPGASVPRIECDILSIKQQCCP